MSSERLREFHEHVNFQGFAGPESSITAFTYANGRERSSLYDPQVSLEHERSLAYLPWIGWSVQINRYLPSQVNMSLRGRYRAVSFPLSSTVCRGKREEGVVPHPLLPPQPPPVFDLAPTPARLRREPVSLRAQRVKRCLDLRGRNHAPQSVRPGSTPPHRQNCAERVVTCRNIGSGSCICDCSMQQIQ